MRLSGRITGEKNSKSKPVFAGIIFTLTLLSCQQINGPTDPEKQLNLAEAYHIGEGIVRNYEKAYFWALISLANGSDAEYILAEIEYRYLSKRQVIEIQNKALKWYRKHKQLVTIVIAPRSFTYQYGINRKTTYSLNSLSLIVSVSKLFNVANCTTLRLTL